MRGTMAGNAPKRPPWLRNCLCSAGASALCWNRMDRWSQVWQRSYSQFAKQKSNLPTIIFNFAGGCRLLGTEGFKVTKKNTWFFWAKFFKSHSKRDVISPKTRFLRTNHSWNLIYLVSTFESTKSIDSSSWARWLTPTWLKDSQDSFIRISFWNSQILFCCLDVFPLNTCADFIGFPGTKRFTSPTQNTPSEFESIWNFGC